MLPAVLIAISCALMVAVASAIVYRRRAPMYNGDSDDEDDDEDPESEHGLRVAAESAALMDGDSDSMKLKPPQLDRQSAQQDGSLLSYVSSLFAYSSATNIKKTKLMQRRNKGVKKIHKPYFFPLLDETAQWFADWESQKQLLASNSQTVEVRIDKLSDTAAVSPRELLEGLDCASLVPFCSSSHTVIPAAVI